MRCSPVLNKSDFYRRWQNMEFGNRSQSWNTLRAVLASKHPGPFAIRYKVAGSKWCRYHILRAALRGVTQQFISEGAQAALMEFSPMQPDQHLIAQGEVQVDHRGLCVLFSREKAPMRVALATQSRQVFGVVATKVLEWACDPQSASDIVSIAEAYTGHVIEFSAYSRAVGVIPNRNTVIWEVRRY